MKFLPRGIRVGDAVRVRRQRWRLVDVRPYERCILVTLVGIGPGNSGTRRQFVWPYDDVEPLTRSGQPRWVRLRTWRRAWRALIADHGPPSMLRAAWRARIDLLPHQLEPALAVVSGLASRVLLCDEVGLGKTIQAGLILTELRARGAADRVLVLTPAGLRDQWSAELSQRFDVEGSIVDGPFLKRRAVALPLGLNPWSTLPLAIASIDYVKRPEVLPAVRSCRWDLLIVDEAHGVSLGSDRYAAVHTLAAETPYVVLSTATPHNGDPSAFAALCGLGAHDDTLLVFRRTRGDVGIARSRRVRRLLIEPTPAEARMHVLLSHLTRMARAERGDADRGLWLALTVLHKRALSSAYALERTVRRRLAGLADGSSTQPSQLALPLRDDADTEEGDDEPLLTEPLLRDASREAQLLSAIADAARLASTAESKLAMLKRWLTRLQSRRESAIVFTEYRDTLQHVRGTLRLRCAVLHGGMARDERRAALAEFTSGRAPVLLATDAAGEGLNLQSTCRIVFNLELPWNPMRLEQRAGRVDRIGQSRTVHTVQLIARGTGETQILERLESRMAQARSDLGTPPAHLTEDAIVRLVVAGGDGPAVLTTDEGQGTAGPYSIVRLLEEAAETRCNLLRVRAVMSLERKCPTLLADRLLVSCARGSRMRQRLSGNLLLILRTILEDEAGRTLASNLTGLLVRLRRPLDQFAQAAITRLQADMRRFAAADPSIQTWIRQSATTHQAFWAGRLNRELAISSASFTTPGSLVQPGLFDRRAERERDVALAARQERVDEGKRRVAAVQQAATIMRSSTDLVLALLP